ncbi:hypothetical protein ACFL18_01365 [Patescibacteria group bacterium]
MKQHPLPQNVTAYKFRLVGDMTLKQFLELAAGIVSAWLIFSSNLSFIFKWTLGPMLGFLGIALAFMPVEDRSLDQWIINFFKAIYKPTQFTYQPSTKDINIFKTKAPPPPTTQPTPAVSSDKLDEFLQTLPDSPATAFDKAEKQYLEHINSLFGALGSTTPISISSQTPPAINPSLSKDKNVKIRKLMHPKMCLLPHATLYQSPPKTKTATAPTKPFPKPQASKKPVVNASFAKDLILPQIPDKPNLIAGITLNHQNKIIPNVILEIKNSQNQSVRALKSNKLGQFFIATPLDDGVYQIMAEQQDHQFDIIKLEAKGEVIPPIKIQAKN